MHSTLHFKYTLSNFCLARSIAEWFDEEGTLLLELLYSDVDQLHTRVKTKKTN